MEDNPRVISPTFAEVAKAILAGLELLFINNIKDEEIRVLVQAHVAALKRVATVLADENPENSDQVRTEVFTVLGSSTLPFASGKLIESINAKITDPRLKQTALVMADALTKSSYLLVDDDKNDLDQLGEFWRQFAASEEALTVLGLWIEAITSKWVKRESDRKFIASQIQVIITYIIERQKEEQG